MPRYSKHAQRLFLADKILSSPDSVIMSSSHACSACRLAERPCIITQSSDRCEGCLRRPYTGCDAKKFDVYQLNKVSNAREKIKKRITEESEQISKLVSLAESLAQQAVTAGSDLAAASRRLRRFQLMETSLQAREQELIARGLSELDAEDGVPSPAPNPDLDDFLSSLEPGFAETLEASAHNASSS